MKLNLGAGNRINEGWINHDRWKHRDEIDSVWDLDELPWPWKDDSIEEIEAVSVLEHLAVNLVQALDECWRILKPKGVLTVKYPLWTATTAHDDPTHRWWWSERVFEVFDPETKYGQDHPYYTDKKWRIMSWGIIKNRNVKVVLVPRK